MEHYANAFTCSTTGCFRMIQAESGTGHAQHCPYRTIWRGRFKDGAGKWHTVESCDGHRADLDSVQRIIGDPHTIAQEARKAGFWTEPHYPLPTV